MLLKDIYPSYAYSLNFVIPAYNWIIHISIVIVMVQHKCTKTSTHYGQSLHMC